MPDLEYGLPEQDARHNWVLFDAFLAEEGILEICEEQAIKEILADQIKTSPELRSKSSADNRLMLDPTINRQRSSFLRVWYSRSLKASAVSCADGCHRIHFHVGSA